MIAYCVSALGRTVERMRARIERTEETEAVTQDLFIATAAELEKYHWMVQATQQ